MKFTALTAVIATTSALESVKLIGETPEDKQASDLSDYEFTKEFYHTMWNSSVKGWYKSSKKNVIGEECLGSWMDEGMEMMTKQIDDNLSFPSASDMKETFNFAVDVVYKNTDKCDVFKVTADTMTWCADNYETCVFNGIVERAKENAIPLGMKGMEIFNIFSNQKHLFTSKDSIQRIGMVVEDFAYVAATLIGFSGDLNTPASELTFDQLQLNIDEAGKKYREEHPHPKIHFPKMPHFMPHGMPSMDMPNMRVPHMAMPPMPQFGMPPMRMPHMQMPNMQMPQMQMPNRQFFVNLQPRSPFGFPQSSFSNFSLF